MIFRNKKQIEKPYKFRELKVYDSTEWLAEGKKNYKSVFEESQVAYLYTELSFFNKMLDLEDWDAHIQLRAFLIKDDGKTEQVCEINTTQHVAKDAAIIYVREGWGNQEPGGFWKEGDYIWEAYIENEHVGTKPFYVETEGPVTAEENPYFEVSSVRLFEGPSKGQPKEEREYLSAFSNDDTRYIWVEFVLENMVAEDWFCELKFHFVNSAGQLKGNTVELLRVAGEDNTVTVVTGWGSDSRGSWFPGRYRLEVIFMDQLLGVLPFSVGQAKPGVSRFITGSEAFLNIPEKAESLEDEAEVGDAFEQLNAMVGLTKIKEKIQDYTDYLRFIQLRKERGFREDQPVSLHAVFTGNPGTGKTTVAKMLGRIYKKLGLLSNGKVHEVGRAELVGQYIGQTAPKVKEVLDEARGGVLFIDEAYSLIRSNEDSKDYGHEVVETLVKEMSDGKGDIAIVVAGYPNEMDVFLESNPGLKSRFNLFFNFPDYLPQELIQIAEIVAEKHEVRFDQEAHAAFFRLITDRFRRRDRSFGNARTVVQLVEEAKMNLGLRVMKGIPSLASEPEASPKSNESKVVALSPEKETDENPPTKPSDENLRYITRADIEKIGAAEHKALPLIDVDHALLNEALDELQGMIGLSEIKTQIRELVDLVRFYKSTGRNVLNRFSLHAVFKGNPGTGKTTVARILAKIYKALGILEKGHIVEADRQALVAGYVGQTAIKTKSKIDEALGGVLFIDEAYALTSPQGSSDFGNEAIEVILKEMEDKRGELIIIVAGYPDNMEKFLLMNPGLQSRFDKNFMFKDFSVEELYEIASKMLEDEGLTPDEEAHAFLKESLEKLYSGRDKYFGNARTVRRIVEEAIKKQHLRMAALDQEARTRQALGTLNTEDLKAVSFTEDGKSRRAEVGFRRTDNA